MKKKFDCVAMKRKIQADLYQETKALTGEELLAYYKKSVETGPLADRWKKVSTAQDQRNKEVGLKGRPKKIGGSSEK